jgi:hypothetical protein
VRGRTASGRRVGAAPADAAGRAVPKMAVVTSAAPEPVSSATGALQPPAARRPVRVWDVVVTSILLVLLVLFALGASYAGFFLAFASDACMADSCDFALMNTGFWIAVVSPWVLLLVAVVFGIVQLVRRRLSFWIPVAAGTLMVGAWFASAGIVWLAVGR